MHSLRYTLPLVLFAALFFVGCGKKPVPKPSGLLTVGAPLQQPHPPMAKEDVYEIIEKLMPRGYTSPNRSWPTTRAKVIGTMFGEHAVEHLCKNPYDFKKLCLSKGIYASCWLPTVHDDGTVDLRMSSQVTDRKQSGDWGSPDALVLAEDMNKSVRMLEMQYDNELAWVMKKKRNAKYDEVVRHLTRRQHSVESVPVVCGSKERWAEAFVAGAKEAMAASVDPEAVSIGSGPVSLTVRNDRKTKMVEEVWVDQGKRYLAGASCISEAEIAATTAFGRGGNYDEAFEAARQKCAKRESKTGYKTVKAEKYVSGEDRTYKLWAEHGYPYPDRALFAMKADVSVLAEKKTARNETYLLTQEDGTCKLTRFVSGEAKMEFDLWNALLKHAPAGK